MKNNSNVSELVKLTSTDFFQLLSSESGKHLLDENKLSTAYRDFLKSVVDLCINSYSGTPAYFTLKYIRIEFCQLEQYSTSVKKKSINWTLSQKGDINRRLCTRLVSEA